jgi:hypothetical protein
LRLETPRSEEEFVRFLERRSGTFDQFGEIANRDAFILAKSQSVWEPQDEVSLAGFASPFRLGRFS